MPVLATHDYGTVRLFEANGIVEAYFPKSDLVTRAVVKSLRGFFDGSRRAWRVTPRIARKETGDIVVAIREALEKDAPEAWMKALPTLGRICATTRRFHIKLAEGGMRLELPPGHKHEWTLKNKVEGADKDGPTWLVPARHCADSLVKGVITDVIRDDRKVLSDAVDYLDGFAFEGGLDLTPGEAGAIGLIPGNVVFADPSFIRAADPDLGQEPVHEYALAVRSYKEDPEGERTTVRLAVVTGQDGWAALRARFSSPQGVRSPSLDVRHVKGKWARKRD